MAGKTGTITPSKETSTRLVSSGGLRHIAFIMDGNGRWAERRGLPRRFGHSHGASKFKEIVRYCGDIGIRYVTVYAFSTENWSRPEAEVDTIMGLLSDYLDDCEKTAEKDSLRMRFIGDLSRFDDGFRSRVKSLEARTSGYRNSLTVALNYGGRDEIVRACRELAESGREITEDSLGDALDTSGIPDPDLIVRTAGEMRLSNFLMWQSAYSELYFTDTLWPDMTPAEVDRAVADFFSRGRRFGGVKNIKDRSDG